MTAFTTLLNALFIPGKPILGSTGSALRDNAIAIAEADSSVALGLLPTVLLGTLTTTSGTVQTLSGLNLTPYKLLMIFVNGVSNVVSQPLVFDGVTISNSLPTSANGFFGSIIMDLSNSVIAASLGTGGVGTVYGARGTYTTATTSISFTSGGAVFDAGSIRVYGAK